MARYVRSAREHHLEDVDVDIPRDALGVFTGISGPREVAQSSESRTGPYLARFLE